MATESPLIRLEQARIEWRAKRRELLGRGTVTPATAALVQWMDQVIDNLTVVIDSTRMLTTILGGSMGVYSESVALRFEEIQARREFRRTA